MAPNNSPNGLNFPNSNPQGSTPPVYSQIVREAELPAIPATPPNAQKRPSLLIVLLLIIIALLMLLIAGGFYYIRNNSAVNQLAAASSITNDSASGTGSEQSGSNAETSTEQSGLASNSGQSESDQANTAAQQIATNAGLDVYGFDILSCWGSDTWVFAALSTEGKHVLICQSSSTNSYYYTHDYLTEIYRKDVNVADVKAGRFEIYNDDATILVDPSGVWVKAKQGSDFSSTFSSSFTDNPW